MSARSLMAPPAAPAPEQLIMQLASGKMISKALSVVADLGVADHLVDAPDAPPTPIAELAARTGSDPDALYRVLRAAAAFGVLREAPGRAFTLTPAGRLLRSDAPGSLRAFVRWMNEDSSWAAWGRLADSVRTGEPAFERVHGQPVFEYFSAHPETAAIFDAAMTSLSAGMAGAVAEAYDFGDVRRIVDIGGGQGMLLGAILGRHPQISGVLFERPEVLPGARKHLEAAGLLHRVDVAGGDFFEGVPAGADAYLMKAIIHDWDDDRCVTLLRNCREAMADGGRVLVVEGLISDRPEAMGTKLVDLEMLVMTSGGRERTQAELGALFERAGLRLTRVIPTPSPVMVIEGVAA